MLWEWWAECGEWWAERCEEGSGWQGLGKATRAKHVQRCPSAWPRRAAVPLQLPHPEPHIRCPHPSQTLARTVAGGGRGAEGAAATLAAFNIPLVYHLARRFQGRGLAREVGGRVREGGS